MIRTRAVALATLAALAGTVPVHAQTGAAAGWPDRPVRLVVPYPPGGNVDTAARIVAEHLSGSFRQPFIVENKPGAGGLIAGESVAKAAPDGYTYFMGANGPILFAPLIFKRPVYDWKKDFAPVSSVSFTPLVLQVHPSTPYKTFAELVTAGRTPGATLTMASPGAGTTNHLLSEYLQGLTGARWTTVHYKGNAPATTDLLGGQVNFNFDQLSVALPYIQQGRTRALAVTSAARMPQLPGVPTLQEAGFKDFTAETFTGILAPAATPREIVDAFSAALRKALADKVVMQKFEALGAEARGATPEQFGQYLKKEDDTWTPIIRKAGITAE
jgi:tripartite-type tricarboxylate transporter receptor subunit TctC